jgi:hypothetical protein
LPVHTIIDMNGTLLHSLNTFQDLSIHMSGILTMEHHPADGAKISTDGNIEFSRENRLSK